MTLLKLTQNGETFFIKLPHVMDIKRPSRGEKFTVQYSRDGKIFEARDVVLLADGKSFLVGTQVIRFNGTPQKVKKNVSRFFVGDTGSNAHNTMMELETVRPVEPKKKTSGFSGGEVRSPMTGKILSVLLKAGDSVEEGDAVLTIEAMKMENRIVAEMSGVIKEIRTEVGKSVTLGDSLFIIMPKA